MKIDLTETEVALIVLLLEQDLSATRVGIHHCRKFEYKEMLKAREKEVQELIDRLRQGNG